MRIPATQFSEYAEAILSLPEASSPGDLSVDPLLLESTDNLLIYYAPFDHINTAAKVIIVGITPGERQMLLAFDAARQALVRGMSAEAVLEAAKRAASFAGSMRSNLAGMLDGIGLHTALGLTSTARLFEDDGWPLLHPTSAVRYPVFKRDRHGSPKNYSGTAPDLATSPVLMRYVYHILVPEIVSISNALVIPLGSAVQRTLRRVVQEGHLRSDRCLFDFPHPSGANGSRVKDYAKHRLEMEAVISRWFDT